MFKNQKLAMCTAIFSSAMSSGLSAETMSEQTKVADSYSSNVKSIMPADSVNNKFIFAPTQLVSIEKQSAFSIGVKNKSLDDASRDELKLNDLSMQALYLSSLGDKLSYGLRLNYHQNLGEETMLPNFATSAERDSKSVTLSPFVATRLGPYIYFGGQLNYETGTVKINDEENYSFITLSPSVMFKNEKAELGLVYQPEQKNQDSITLEQNEESSSLEFDKAAELTLHSRIFTAPGQAVSLMASSLFESEVNPTVNNRYSVNIGYQLQKAGYNLETYLGHSFLNYKIQGQQNSANIGYSTLGAAFDVRLDAHSAIGFASELEYGKDDAELSESVEHTAYSLALRTHVKI
ncbi:MAG: hypothetical protein KBD78_03085 [Oligoflexales bacterium]|nr:hypothetical protein [Oligoflexales bacterium]